MQFLRNQLPDFKNSWNCLILTLLRIEQCTMYPPHLNYATTLPCKTLTMKITIFTLMLVLKSEENIACYQFKTPWKQYLKTCSKCPPPAFTQARSFWRCSVWLCLWSSVADRPMWAARLSSARRWYLAWVEMSPPQTWESRCLRSGEFGGHSSSPTKSLQLATIQFGASFAAWAGALSCWNMKPNGTRDLQSSTSLGNRLSR